MPHQLRVSKIKWVYYHPEEMRVANPTREMNDREFLDFYKDAYQLWEMSDDELIDSHLELDVAINGNWDNQKYLCWFQDPSCRPIWSAKTS